MTQHPTPDGIQFYDQADGKDKILVESGPFNGWICYKHPDGQWVTERKATDQDKLLLRQAKTRGQL